MTALMTRVMATLSPRLLRAAGYPVGLHLGGDRLSAAQMQRTASGLALSAVASLDLGCPCTRCWASRGASSMHSSACGPNTASAAAR